MSEPALDEFWRCMKQSERDSAAHFWKQFEPAAHALLSLGMTEVRLEPEAFMMLKRALPPEHIPCFRDMDNGRIRLFGRLWVGQNNLDGRALCAHKERGS